MPKRERSTGKARERAEEEVGRRGEREDASSGAEPAGPLISSAAEAKPRSQRGLGGSALSAALPGNPAQAAMGLESFARKGSHVRKLKPKGSRSEKQNHPGFRDLSLKRWCEFLCRGCLTK